MKKILLTKPENIYKTLINLSDDEEILIELTGKRYDFYSDNTFTKEYYISNNDVSDKHVAFPFINKKNITLEGNGAELIFHGEILPFLTDKSENITIRNLAVDYNNPFYSQARIVNSASNYTDLEFSSDFGFEVSDGELLFKGNEDGWTSKRENRILVTEFTPAGKPRDDIGAYLARFTPAKEPSFLDGMTINLKAEQISENTVRLHGVGIHKPGNYWVCTHADRNAPGFFITGSKNINIENIKLYHTASMGIIAQLSDDITLKSVMAKPRENSGRLLSTAADATHFVNCGGKVTIEDCTFVNMLDDAANIHGIYTVIADKPDSNTLTVQFCHFQQYGTDLYEAGDRLDFVDRKTMMPYYSATVKTAHMICPQQITITFEEPLPDSVRINDAVENTGRMPKVLIRGCVTGNNRPRGFLISTPKQAVVESCHFFNMYQGIHVVGDANDWFESGSVHDLTIRNNFFDDSAFCGEAAIRIDPRVPAGEKIPYHSNISVYGNRFKSKSKRFIFARNVENLRFYDNEYEFDGSGSDAQQTGKDGIDIDTDEKLQNIAVIPKNI